MKFISKNKMSTEITSNKETTNFDRSFMKTHITEELKRRRRQMENFAPKITQNNPALLDASIKAMHRAPETDSKEFIKISHLK